MLNHLRFFGVYLFTIIIFPIILLPIGIVFKLFNVKCDLWQFNAGFSMFQILGLKHKIIYDAPLIKQGYILCNHRCFFDFAIDPYVARASIIGRILPFVVVFPFALIGKVFDRIIYFKRGSTGRNVIFQLMKNHMNNKSPYAKRVVFYPEGTRKNYQTLDSIEDVKKNFKFGILKEIYEDKKYPVQIVMTSKKDEIFNEKRFSAKSGLSFTTIVNNPINPEEYKTFEDFVEEIAANWLLIHNNLF